MRNEVRVLPKLFLERLRRIIPSQRFDSIANTFAAAKPTTFRVNTLKTSRGVVRNTLEDTGFQLAPVSWYSDAFILRRGRLRELEKTEVYARGQICVQGLSSMIPVLLLDPKPGELVLDLTAAPGSKTTQMACLMIPPPVFGPKGRLSPKGLLSAEKTGGGMKGKGHIVANDSNEIRFARLKANVVLQDAKNVELIRSYGESIGRKYPEHFDRILVDAPCSAEGRFDVHEPSSYRYWSLEKVKAIAKTQRKLIHSALLALKPGGVLVYSTCTFAPEENEAVVNEALNKFRTVRLEEINFAIPNRMVGLSTWEGERFDCSLKKTFRVLPTLDMEGFFVARLRKL